MSDYYEKQRNEYLDSLKNPKYFKVDEVSIIVKPEDKDGKTFFYDLCGNRVTKISRKPKDTSIVNDCYLGLKKFKNSERWVPIKSEDVDERLSDKEFIKNHSKEYNPEKVKIKKKDVKKNDNNIYQILRSLSENDLTDFSVFFEDRFEKFINELVKLPEDFKSIRWNYFDFYNKFLGTYTNKWEFKGGNYLNPLEGSSENSFYINIYPDTDCSFEFYTPIYEVRQFKDGLFSTVNKTVISKLKKSSYHFELKNSEFFEGLNLKEIELKGDDLKFVNLFKSSFDTLLNKEFEEFLQFKSKRKNISNDLDKDGNGTIDIIEGTGDELTKLLRKHQSKVIEVDKNYVQSIIKISNYLKNKRENIQSLFLLIKESSTEFDLENNMGLLKNNIHTHNLVLFHSLNLITSIVENDLITFYEIYESFDKLKIFNTSWENEVSQKLSEINLNLNELMNSIDKMERSIVKEIGNLTYVTEQSFKELGKTVTEELQSIDSSIKFNNLLTGISTYQLYKINKQTKGLLKG